MNEALTCVSVFAATASEVVASLVSRYEKTYPHEN